jgi:hypothetical protein
MDSHNKILNKLDEFDNVDYRNRELQNLWGINRDYEEVVLCVLSETMVKGEMRTEIAGIGSIIEEHIKIFVPILEDAWMSARKELARPAPQTQLEPELSIKPLEEPKSIEEPISEGEMKPEGKEEVKSEPIQESIMTKEPQQEVEIKESLENLPLLEKQFLSIGKDLDSIKGKEIAIRLEEFHQDYVKEKGYNSTIKNIHRNMHDLQERDEILSKPERSELKMKIKFWRKKLDF